VFSRMKWFMIMALGLVGLDAGAAERFRSPLPPPVTPMKPLQEMKVTPAPTPLPVPGASEGDAPVEGRVSSVAAPATVVPKSPPLPRQIPGFEPPPAEPVKPVTQPDGWQAAPAAPTVVWTNSSQSAPGSWSQPAPARSGRPKKPPVSIWDKPAGR